MAVNKNILFYLAGGALALLLLIYVVSLINALLSNMSVIAGPQVTQPPAIVTYDFEKFKQIKGVPR